MFYRAVVQSILICRLEMWVFSAEMERKVEGIYTGLLQQIMGKQVQQIGDGTWEISGAEGVREASGTQLVMTYIERRQATMAQQVALHPLFEVCSGGKGYEGGGRRR